ncbi:MAG: NUDIX domain-containing protein [Pseudomonadota bacterium]
MKQRILSAGIMLLHPGHAAMAPDGKDAALYLLLRSYRYWDFPKGMVEPGEEPFQAACREVEEETTLTDLSFPWGQTYRETAPYGAGKVARYYLAVSGSDQVRLPVNPALGFAEHQEFRWASYQAARALLGPRLQSVLDWGHALRRE